MNSITTTCRTLLCSTVLIALGLSCVQAFQTGGTNAPLWWTDPPAVLTTDEPNDLGPANLGQAKWFAKRALETLDVVAPNVAGEIRSGLFGPEPEKALPSPASLELPAVPDQAWYDLHKAPLLIGQLKAIAAPFYDVLHLNSPDWLTTQMYANQTLQPGSGHYPWTDDVSDDNNSAVANLGQLKAVFALHLSTVVEPSVDVTVAVLSLDGAFARAAAVVDYSEVDAVLYPSAAGDPGARLVLHAENISPPDQTDDSYFTWYAEEDSESWGVPAGEVIGTGRTFSTHLPGGASGIFRARLTYRPVGYREVSRRFTFVILTPEGTLPDGTPIDSDIPDPYGGQNPEAGLWISCHQICWNCPVDIIGSCGEEVATVTITRPDGWRLVFQGKPVRVRINGDQEGIWTVELTCPSQTGVVEQEAFNVLEEEASANTKLEHKDLGEVADDLEALDPITREIVKGWQDRIKKGFKLPDPIPFNLSVKEGNVRWSRLYGPDCCCSEIKGTYSRETLTIDGRLEAEMSIGIGINVKDLAAAGLDGPLSELEDRGGVLGERLVNALRNFIKDNLPDAGFEADLAKIVFFIEANGAQFHSWEYFCPKHIKEPEALDLGDLDWDLDLDPFLEELDAAPVAGKLDVLIEMAKAVQSSIEDLLKDMGERFMESFIFTGNAQMGAEVDLFYAKIPWEGLDVDENVFLSLLPQGLQNFLDGPEDGVWGELHLVDGQIWIDIWGSLTGVYEQTGEGGEEICLTTNRKKATFNSSVEGWAQGEGWVVGENRWAPMQRHRIWGPINGGPDDLFDLKSEHEVPCDSRCKCGDESAHP